MQRGHNKEDYPMKRFTLVALATCLIGFTSAAFAADAQPSTTTTVPDGCKLVSVSRPDVSQAMNEIYVTFEGYGGDVAAIDACNPPAARQSKSVDVFGVVGDPVAGARVSIRTKNGVGVVGLPTIFSNGVAHQVACDHNGRKISFQLYKIGWSSGLPDRIELANSTKEIADQAAFYQQSCFDSAPPQLRAQLDDPSKSK